jgi:hypothetical protein
MHLILLACLLAGYYVFSTLIKATHVYGQRLSLVHLGEFFRRKVKSYFVSKVLGQRLQVNQPE